MTTSNSVFPAPAAAAPRRRWRWWLWLPLIVLAALFVIFFIAMPAGGAVWATSARPETVGAPPDGFQALTLTTEDGVDLAAWYRPPQNGAAIILLHGANNSREGVRAHIPMLVDAGYGVLALDLRGMGASGGQVNLFGWQSGLDVKAAVAFLEGQPDVRGISGLGLSLGGETLLGAAWANPALRGIVSEGATHRSLEEFRALPSHDNPFVSFQSRILYLTVGLITGQSPPLPMVKSIQATTETRFLLIASEAVEDEAEFAAAFAASAPGRAEVWSIPGVGHIGGFGGDPAEYARRVVAFFDSALLGG
ncbi:MAG: alpha/beta hydrolase [Anaerolineae bacterium]|nr:alpha/beta hydrolase [Anaerolineae bacterium]